MQKESHRMVNMSQDEIKASLMQSNEEFRALADKHAEYARLIDGIESKPHVTEQDEVEEHRLKKLKLHLKDQMQEMVNRYREAQTV
jgi:uncharacterized protein YdcH (DUF465 family)